MDSFESVTLSEATSPFISYVFDLLPNVWITFWAATLHPNSVAFHFTLATIYSHEHSEHVCSGPRNIKWSVQRYSTAPYTQYSTVTYIHTSLTQASSLLILVVESKNMQCRISGIPSPRTRLSLFCNSDSLHSSSSLSSKVGCTSLPRGRTWQVGRWTIHVRTYNPFYTKHKRNSLNSYYYSTGHLHTV